MKGITKMTKEMDLEYLKEVVKPMKVNGNLMSMKDKEFLLKIMETNILDFLKEDNWMDLELKNTKMGTVL